MFKSNMIICYIIWIFIVACQSTILPMTKLVPYLVVATGLLTSGVVAVMAEEVNRLPATLRRLSRAVVRTRLSRTWFILCFVSLMSLSSTLVLFQKMEMNDLSKLPCDKCNREYMWSGSEEEWKRSGAVNRSGVDTGFNRLQLVPPRLQQTYKLAQSPRNTTLPQLLDKPTNSSVAHCSKPQFLVFTWVLCLIALATTLKMYFLLKVALAGVMVTCYSLLITVFYQQVFQNDSDKNVDITAQMLLMLIIFLILVGYHARLVEVTSRLDYLWKQEAQRELLEMRETRKNNRQLLRNILPDHVARRFLNDTLSDELYSQSRDKVAVMFASIPNFTEFYSEDVNKGVECIRLLNEIIVDFDELLSETRFLSIEKIKTVGACYMAASGLNPSHDREDESKQAGCLVEFAVAMKQALDSINKHSFNNFHLRVGISSGPLVGGVIGARKPVFDIWGNTVNEASRMDSTGKLGRIQVPHHTAMLLMKKGYQLEHRGLVQVKGKGQMETYFVMEKGELVLEEPAAKPCSLHSSLAAVVYGMVQARRRHHTVNRPTHSTGVLNRTKSQQAPASQSSGRLVSHFSSFRVPKPSSSPLRRNTTKPGGRAGGLRVVDVGSSLHQLSAPDTRTSSPNVSSVRSVSMNFTHQHS